MPLPRVVAFSASINRPSRTRSLVEAVAAGLALRQRIDLRVFDLIDAGPGLGALTRDGLSLPAARLIEAIEGADALIVGSPVYKGAYSGLFKHVFDFVEPEALAGKPVALAATGGGQRHALVVEHAMRPLFGFFAAHIAPTAVYAGGEEIADGRVVDPGVAERVAAAAAEMALLIDAARASGAGRRAAPAA
ncbi:NAD(P)H-dependent oxidoreductase [Methylobacterium sp. A54F]